MKKFKYIIAFMAISTLWSCQKDFLDQAPLDELSDDTFWSTKNEALAAVTGVYSSWEDGVHLLYMDCASDNAFNQFPWEGYTVLGNGQATAADNGAAGGRFNYEIIRRANYVLANIDKAPLEEDLLNRLKAEVRFIRAYRYFDMVTLFGDVSLVTEPLSLEESNVPRTPKDSVLAFVKSELTEIAATLPTSYPAEDKGRITKGAALGIRARLEMFAHDYAAAKATTQEIIDLGIYELFPNYAGVFNINNERHSGVLLNVEYLENDFSMGSLGVLLPNSVGGWSSIVPTQALVNAYGMANGKPIDAAGSGFDPAQPYKNRDPRLNATVVYPGALYAGKYHDPLSSTSNDYPPSANNTSKTGYNFKKYIADPSSYNDVWNTGTNIIVMRYAEVLLLNAEAKIELGELDASVYAAINKVRQRAGVPVVNQTVYASQGELRELVHNELRVELAGEGRRWFDLVRWQLADELMPVTVKGTYNAGSVNPNTGAVTFTSTERFIAEQRSFDAAKNYLWPIPQSAIDNSKGVITQNLGY